MALALRLFLLLLLAVALHARAAQAAPVGARGADWDGNLDNLEMLLQDDFMFLEFAGAEPVAEGDPASQATSRTEPLRDGMGVSAGRTFPAPRLDAVRKPGSRRRGPPTGKDKAAGHKKPREPLKIMRKLLKEMLQGGQGMDREALWKAAFLKGREAMPGMGSGDAAGTTTCVPSEETGIRRDVCQGARCFLVLTPGLVCLVLLIILWYVGCCYHRN